MGGRRREEKSDECVWQDSLSYATPVTQLLCKMISAIKQATKSTLTWPVGEALGNGNTCQMNTSPGQFWSSWA